MKKTELPVELQEIRSFLPEIVHRLEEKIPYVSALVTQESGVNLSIDSKQEVISQREPKRGIVFTLFNGRFFQEWATDCLDRVFLLRKADEMVRLVADMEQMESRFTIDPGKVMDQHFVTAVEIDPDDVLLSEMVDACRDLIGRVSSMDYKIVNSRVSYRDGKEHKIFVNRNKVLSSSLTTCSINLAVIGHHQGATHLNYIGADGVMGFEAIKFKKSDLQELVDDLNLLFESRPLDPGTYQVISSPEVSGILAHEAFGHGVEADMFVKGRAKAAEFLNQKVASELVDMNDDPALPGLNGSYFFDDEGQISSETKIIEKGILKRGLTDLRSATVLGLERSANGRRESFERKVYSRMSNTFFDKGKSCFSDMISSVDDGLYLKKSGSGMEDPKGWGIQVGINLAQEIKGGKLTSRVYSPLTMTGYMPDVLKSIDQVGNELGFMGGGMCGKGHKEMVRVSAGGPHLRFKVRLG